MANGEAPDPGRKDALTAVRECLRAADPRKLVRKSMILRGGRIRIQDGAFDLSSFEHLFVIGGGKASALMAEATERILGDRITAGKVIVPEYQKDLPRLKRIRFLKSTHPIPSQRGVDAVREMLGLVRAVGPRDLVLCLFSGGGSALMPKPIKGASVADIRSVTDLLLKSGANISDINCVRRHLSEIAGGRLAEMLSPATVVSLILSDVIGDDIVSVASGPTVPDHTTFDNAMRILKRERIWAKVPPPIRKAIEDGTSGRIPETPKPGSPSFAKVHNVVIGSNSLAVKSVSKTLRRLGYHVSERFETQGEARDFGSRLAGEALTKGNLQALVAGGETVVRVEGHGKGGRNQEICLAAALEIAGRRDITILSFSTDGVDGPTDAAGAVADGTTVRRAEELGMSAAEYLDRHDSYHFFKPLGDLVITGPTGTNVNDVTVALVRNPLRKPRFSQPTNLSTSLISSTESGTHFAHAAAFNGGFL